MEIETTTRKWGNSIAIIVPARIVEQQNLKENEKVSVKIEKRKRVKVKDVFGLLPNWKRPTDEILAEADKGWD
ncbi:MAG: AbrB/MazE/SpoVT family DNA-binding domain-containing protein [Nanoarchaeota archaeon]